jgi:hypothetical protein
VADYGSDSDTEASPSAPPQPPSRPKPAPVAARPQVVQAPVQPKRKKKKIAVSILPPEIQAALARGGADSDDEGGDDQEVRSAPLLSPLSPPCLFRKSHEATIRWCG